MSAILQSREIRRKSRWFKHTEYHKAAQNAAFQRVYFHASQKVVAGLARVQAFRNHIPTSGGRLWLR